MQEKHYSPMIAARNLDVVSPAYKHTLTQAATYCRQILVSAPGLTWLSSTVSVMGLSNTTDPAAAGGGGGGWAASADSEEVPAPAAELPPVAVGTLGLAVQAAIGVRNSHTWLSPIRRDCRVDGHGRYTSQSKP